ncbi:unnamed protein product [Calicophoron daubneyi]|uniref:Solute carrier family 25 member 51 n=1 Tax=Calicophoron daubneyi TaxID=300641 RepID=A0AAV2TZG2_CALDB
MLTSMKLEKSEVDKFIFGGAAYSVSVLTLFPFYKTVFFQQLDGITWPQALHRLHQEGLKMAYRGVLPPLLQRALSGSVMFGVQNLSERALAHHSLSGSLPFGVNKVLSALCAGVCEASLMPFERVQTLLQNRHYFPSYKNTFQTLASLTLDHGVKELYRGLTPVVIRNSAGNVVYFGGHQLLHDLRKRTKKTEGPLERSMWNFAFGGLLGGTISLLLFPLNVIKTRMQSSVGGGFEEVRSVLFALIYHRNNRADFGRLYKGVPANFIRSVLSWGIITMTYHLLVEFSTNRTTVN